MVHEVVVCLDTGAEVPQVVTFVVLVLTFVDH